MDEVSGKSDLLDEVFARIADGYAVPIDGKQAEGCDDAAAGGDPKGKRRGTGWETAVFLESDCHGIVAILRLRRGDSSFFGQVGLIDWGESCLMARF